MLLALLLVMLVMKHCCSYSKGPPYGVCESFLTRHPDSPPSGVFVSLSLQMQDSEASCYTPGESYIVQVNATRIFNGLILQADRGALTVFTSVQKLANGPCDHNTVSNRDMLNADRVVFSFIAPAQTELAEPVNFRYTMVFSYTESFENRVVSIPVCLPMNPATNAPSSWNATNGSMGAQVPPSTPVSALACNRTVYLSNERQNVTQNGLIYDCVLPEYVKQAYCEPTCVVNGTVLCCSPYETSSVNRFFNCTERRTFETVQLRLQLVRYMRCSCTVAQHGKCADN